MKNCSSKLKIIIIALILNFSFLTFHSRVVGAQEVELSLSPSLHQIAIQPGKSTTVSYKLQNTADPATVSVKLLPFQPNGQTGAIKLGDHLTGPMKFSLGDSSKSLDQAFFLKPKESSNIRLQIEVPEDAQEGDYYYSLLVQSEPPPTAEGVTQVRARASVGSNILITVTRTGEVEINGTIKNFSVEPRIYDSFDTIPVNLTVENKGGNVIRPTSEITLKGFLGGRVKYDMPTSNILSHSSRQSTMVLRGFFIGNNKLSSTVSFGEGAPVLFAQTSFIALPIKFFAIILALLIFILITLSLRKRTHKK